MKLLLSPRLLSRTMSAMSDLLLAPRYDHKPVVIKVFREAATGMAYGITDSGEVRPLMLVQEPPLLSLNGRVHVGASAQELQQLRCQLALEAPPLTTQNQAWPLEITSGDDATGDDYNPTDRALVASVT